MKQETGSFYKGIVYVGIVAVVLLGLGLYTNTISFGTQSVAPTVVPTVAGGSSINVQVTGTTLVFSVNSKYALTDTAIAGNYKYIIDGTPTATTAFTTAGASIANLPPGKKGIIFYAWNGTTADFTKYYLDSNTIDLIDCGVDPVTQQTQLVCGTSGQVTTSKTVKLFRNQVGNTTAEFWKGGVNQTILHLGAGEINADLTVRVKESISAATIRKPSACMYWNVSEIKDVSLYADTGFVTKLPTIETPRRLRNTAVQGGFAQVCYDLTNLVTSKYPNDSPYLANFGFVEAPMQIQASNTGPAVVFSNVTVVVVDQAKYFSTDSVTILEGPEDINNGYTELPDSAPDMYATLQTD